MNNSFKMTLSFMAGAAVGVAASWFILKKKFDEIVNEEIDSFKAEYKQRMEEKKAATENLEQIADDLKAFTEKVQDEEEEAIDIINNEGYSNVEKEGEPDESPKVRKKPYVIKPDELGDEQYEICVLTYYADGILTNDWDEVIEDIEGTVGKESLKTFGQYEADAIYVRNDELELDYEINKDSRRFFDISPDDIEYDE